jgi:hypothetical protein
MGTCRCFSRCFVIEIRKHRKNTERTIDEREQWSLDFETFDSFAENEIARGKNARPFNLDRAMQVSQGGGVKYFISSGKQLQLFRSRCGKERYYSVNFVEYPIL